MKHPYFNIKSAKDYIFISSKYPSNTKVKREALKINYSNTLKYNDIFYFKCKNLLEIYNFKASKISIPEGYLLSKSLDKNGIFVLKNPNRYINIVIKQDNCIIKDYFVNNISNQEKKLLEFEHNLTLFEKDYNKYIKKGIEELSLLEIIKFIKPINIDKNKIKQNIYNLSLPFLILSVLLTITAYSAKIYYQNKLQQKYEILNNLKKQNEILNNQIIQIQKIDKIYNKLNTDLKVNRINLINKIADSLNDNSRISYLRIDQNKIIFTIDANDSTKLLEKLNKIKEIKNLRLISNVSINKNIKRYKFEGEIF